jgi:hypothetical protein
VLLNGSAPYLILDLAAAAPGLTGRRTAARLAAGSTGQAGAPNG